MTDEDVDREFMKKLRQVLTAAQIEALVEAPLSYFKRLAPQCAVLARERGIGPVSTADNTHA